MTEVIFVKTRYQYQSYTDFWYIVGLSGYPTCYVDEMDLYDSNNIYIGAPMNGEWRPYIEPHRKDRQATVILWNIERPGGSGNLQEYTASNQLLIDENYLNAVMVSDMKLAAYTGFHFMPLGIHPRLGDPGGLEDKIHDIIHISCYSPRRSFLFRTPIESKLYINNLSIASNGWGQDRVDKLRCSRFMLNIHQDEFEYLEPLRLTVAAAYGLPILSEPLGNTFPYDCSRFSLYCDKSSKLLGMAEYILRSDEYEKWYQGGLDLREHMIQYYTFRGCVEAYL